jgi:hypothetical protein
MRQSLRLLTRTSRNNNTLSQWSTPQMSTSTDGFAPPRHMTHDPRNVKRETETTPEHVWRVFTENTFEPAPPDDRMFGGNNSTAKSYAMSQLRNMDKRMSLFAHEDLNRNILRTALAYDAPNGQMFTNAHLTGKLVGLLLFSETERCNLFLEELEEFAEPYKEDLVIIGVSYCCGEAINVTRRHGFSHLRHKNGAVLVKRDSAVIVNSFNLLPKLLVCDGTTGEPIDRQGYTSVRARPKTCFQDWVNGRVGSRWYDMISTWVS